VALVSAVILRPESHYFPSETPLHPGRPSPRICAPNTRGVQITAATNRFSCREHEFASKRRTCLYQHAPFITSLRGRHREHHSTVVVQLLFSGAKTSSTVDCRYIGKDRGKEDAVRLLLFAGRYLLMNK
jgi:hypothetical protein